jgi:hypothetical protein
MSSLKSLLPQDIPFRIFFLHRVEAEKHHFKSLIIRMATMAGQKNTVRAEPVWTDSELGTSRKQRKW